MVVGYQEKKSKRREDWGPFKIILDNFGQCRFKLLAGTILAQALIGACLGVFLTLFGELAEQFVC